MINERFKDMVGGYRERVVRKGSTQADEIISDMIEARREFLQHSPTAQYVEINGVEHLVQITDRAFANNDLIYKYIVAEPGVELVPGDYVYWKNEHWMIYISESENIQSKQGASMMPVKDVLTWQDEQGNIYSTPCTFHDSTSVYSSGLTTAGDTIVIRTDQIGVTVQENMFTKQIPYNKRFMFRHDKDLTFKLLRKRVSEFGLLELVMQADTYNVATDNIDMNLPNFITATDVETPIGISGETVVKRYSSEMYRLPLGYTAEHWHTLPVSKDVTQLTMSNITKETMTVTANSSKQIGEHDIISKVLKPNGESEEIRLRIRVVA